MQSLSRSIKAEALLALGGFCMFAGLFLLYVESAHAHSVLPADSFELGQYYFNSTDDPRGAYDPGRARHYYTAAIEADPTAHELAWYQLGRIDFIQGRFESALYAFEKQIEYFKDAVPSVYYMIGLTNGYKAKLTHDPDDWQKAESAFLTFLTYKPDSPWARTDLSWVYFSEGKYEDMLPVLELGLGMHPGHPWLLNMYGLALLNLDRKDEARDVFTRAAEGAASLTTEEWGHAYPGNDPATWEEGLASFRAAIAHNLALVSDTH